MGTCCTCTTDIFYKLICISTVDSHWIGDTVTPLGLCHARRSLKAWVTVVSKYEVTDHDTGHGARNAIWAPFFAQCIFSKSQSHTKGRMDHTHLFFFWYDNGWNLVGPFSMTRFTSLLLTMLSGLCLNQDVHLVNLTLVSMSLYGYQHRVVPIQHQGSIHGGMSMSLYSE